MDIRKNIITYGFLLLLEIGYFVYNFSYALGTLADPGPGLFPLVIALSLFGLTIVPFIRNLKKWRKELSAAAKEPDDFKGWLTAEKKVIIMVAALIVYLLLIKIVGFFTCTFCLALFTCKLMGARDWPRPVGLALGILLFCYLLFEVWLKLALPRGCLA